MYGREYLEAKEAQETRRKARAIVDAIPPELRETVQALIVEDQERERRVREAPSAYANVPWHMPAVLDWGRAPLVNQLFGGAIGGDQLFGGGR